MDNSSTGIVLIDAPSGAGKTEYIKRLGASHRNTLSSEQLIDALIQMCRTRSSVAKLAAELHQISFFENLESLSGKEETQRLAAQLVLAMSQQRPITITGIDFEERLPFFLASLQSFKILHLSQKG